MTDPLDAMKARWNHIQGSLFPWLLQEVEPMTELLGRLVTILDVISLAAYVPEPPRGVGRPQEYRRALARAFVAKAMLGIPTTSALIERLSVDKSLRRMLGWERRAQVPSEATFSRAFAEFARMESIGMPDTDDALYDFRTMVERVNARLKDEFGGRFVRVRGAIKVKCHLMFGILVLAVDQIFRVTAFRPAPI